MQEKEIWRDVKNYEGIYQVSNFGRVKVLPRLRNGRNCTYLSKEKILSAGDNGNGYMFVNLTKNKRRDGQ